MSAPHSDDRAERVHGRRIREFARMRRSGADRDPLRVIAISEPPVVRAFPA
jgi:hypothetical protein